MQYNWQLDEWPDFQYETRELQGLLLRFTEKTGRVDGLLSALPEPIQAETIINLMVAEAVKSSAIEGEMLSRPDVMSSIKNNLGVSDEVQRVGDQRADGIGELMVHLQKSYAQPLGEKMLFEWHKMLMKGTTRIRAGEWRTHAEPMLVVSGTIGKEQVHYEAPPSRQIPGEMKRYIRWFNNICQGGRMEAAYGPVQSAVAHLYFESLHPFEDGNGRIGRALSEKVLSQWLGRPAMLSLSRAVEADRSGYYSALKQAQRTMNITGWIGWFVQTLLNAQEETENEIEFTLKKVRLFDRIGHELNTRQLKVVKRILEEGPDGFQGGMTAKKYIAITKTTKPTATRDLQDLVAKGIFVSAGGGRNTHYTINL
jgi:Fic family protein